MIATKKDKKTKKISLEKKIQTKEKKKTQKEIKNTEKGKTQKEKDDEIIERRLKAFGYL